MFFISGKWSSNLCGHGFFFLFLIWSLALCLSKKKKFAFRPFCGADWRAYIVLKFTTQHRKGKHMHAILPIEIFDWFHFFEQNNMKLSSQPNIYITTNLLCWVAKPSTWLLRNREWPLHGYWCYCFSVGDRHVCQLCSASHQIQETPANIHGHGGTRSWCLLVCSVWDPDRHTCSTLHARLVPTCAFPFACCIQDFVVICTTACFFFTPPEILSWQRSHC